MSKRLVSTKCTPTIAQSEIVQEEVLSFNENTGAYILQKNLSPLYEKVSAEEWVRRCNAGEADNDTVMYSTGKDFVVTSGIRPNPRVTENSKIKPGIYKATLVGNLCALVPLQLESDHYIPVGGATSDIISEIEWFISAKERYRDVGLTHKRGLLIWGPPGNGKTRSIIEASRKFETTAYSIVVDAEDFTIFERFKGYLKGYPVIVVLEELTEMIANTGSQRFLNFLDGADSWDACIAIATTNYPEKLDANMVDRPSRFDRLIHVDSPDADARRVYLSSFIKDLDEQVVENTAGMSIAYLKEMVVQHRLLNKPMTVILDQYKEKMKLLKKNFKTGTAGLGFGG